VVRRLRESLLVSATLVLLTAACGGDGSGGTAAGAELDAAGAADTDELRANQRVLTPEQSRRLVDFANDLRSCLARSEVEIARPHATRTRIDLTYEQSVDLESLVNLVIRCGDGLGGPPPRSSLQTFPTRIVIYVPKQCLLDEKVASETA
jgi:hypothetical protein